VQATDIIQAQKVFYGLETSVGYQLLLALTMQLFGLGLAGLAYKYIVEPPQMVSISPLGVDGRHPNSYLQNDNRSGQLLSLTLLFSPLCTAVSMLKQTAGESRDIASSFTFLSALSSGTGSLVSFSQR
jgi:hypothetical protein